MQTILTTSGSGGHGQLPAFDFGLQRDYAEGLTANYTAIVGSLAESTKAVAKPGVQPQKSHTALFQLPASPPAVVALLQRWGRNSRNEGIAAGMKG